MTYYCVSDTCDGETKVMQTSGVHRRRKCLSCGMLFLTEEVEYVLEPGVKNPFTIAQADRKLDMQARAYSDGKAHRVVDRQQRQTSEEVLTLRTGSTSPGVRD